MVKKKEKTFDVETAKQKLALIKEERKWRDVREPKEIKEARAVWSKEAKKEIAEGTEIRKLEKKIKAASPFGKLKKGIGKLAVSIDKGIPERMTYRRILKKQPRATYIVQSAPRSTSFQKEWNRESMLGWK